ncbi:MAG: DUF1403 family protein [Rhizobiaceae bacterium]
MILRPKPSSLHYATLAGTPSTVPMAVVPSWLRRTIPDAQSPARQGIEDIAIAAGAAIGALDAVVRRQERWSGAWRQRLALSAAAVTATQAGRVEDEVALRDAVLLTKAGDNVGPAGRMSLGWRRLAGTPAEKLLTDASIGTALDDLGFAPDNETANDLADQLRQCAATEGVVGTLVGAFAVVERRGLPRNVGSWFADALLAQRLGWSYAVPLLGTEVNAAGRSRPRRSGPVIAASIEDESGLAKNLLAAQVRAALRAVDLSAELGRKADRLLTVAPRLRAKAADIVVEKLLSDDAIVASEKIAGMSDRGLRRLFDRLVEFGAVRELSGRPTFRIYGL